MISGSYSGALRFMAKVLFFVFRKSSYEHCYTFSPYAPEYWENLFGKIKSHHIDYGEGMTFDAGYVHPNFQSNDKFDDYDMAILRFRLPIHTFSQQVRPICVPDLSK